MRESRSNCENKVCNGRNDKRTLEEKGEWNFEKIIRETGVHIYIERADAVGIEKKDGMSPPKKKMAKKNIKRKCQGRKEIVLKSKAENYTGRINHKSEFIIFFFSDIRAQSSTTGIH